MLERKLYENQVIKSLTIGLALYTCLTSFQAMAQGRKKMGPGDSGGGGTGIANRIYEAYRFDPLETKAFKTFLKPTFDRWDQEAMKEYLQRKAVHEASTQTPFNENEPTPSAWAFKQRNWYLIPGKLEAIASRSLGVEMLTKSSETYAFQNFRELWVSKDHFDRKSTEDQAKLLLHEMIVSTYMMKYQSLTDIFKSFQSKNPQALKSTNKNEPNTIYLELEDLELTKEWSKAPFEFKGLNAEDYANIREVTYWFWSNRAGLTIESLAQVLRMNNFDKRFFQNKKAENSSSSGASSSSTVAVDVTFSLEQLFQKVQEGILTQSIDSTCADPGLNEIKNCRAHFTPNQIIVNQDGRETLVNLSVYKESSISSKFYNSSTTINSISITDIKLSSPSTAKIGDVVWVAEAEVEVVKKYDYVGLGELVSLTLQAYVITFKSGSICIGKPMKQVNGSSSRILFLANNLDSKFTQTISSREKLLKKHLPDFEMPFYCPEK